MFTRKSKNNQIKVEMETLAVVFSVTYTLNGNNPPPLMI